VRCIRGTRRGEVVSDHLLSRCDVIMVESTVEVSQRSLRYLFQSARIFGLIDQQTLTVPMGRRLTLVVWNLVTRLVNAREAEVTVLTHFAIFSTVNDHGCVSCV
jgi:hypothetical protein